MVKADRRGRQNKAEKCFLRRAGIVGRAEGYRLPCFNISRTGEKMSGRVRVSVGSQGPPTR